MTETLLPVAPSAPAAPDAGTTALRLEGLTRRFGARTAVDDVTLDVRPGELFALLGPSGSGKTTLLRLIAGFEAPDAGRVEIAGRPVAGGRAWVEPECRGVGLVPQGDTLFPHLSVGENVAFGVRRDPGRALRALELVGLAGRAADRPGELSGGERQRVALARALAPGPSLILLDEPFSSLDAALRGRLRRDIVDVLDRAGATGVLVTHDQEEALGLADRLAVLHEGRVMQCGTPTDVYWRPADEWTARFLGEVNVFDAWLDGDGASTPLGRFAAPGGARHGRCQVGIRPEHLTLVPGDGGDAVVAGREFRGHDIMYELRHASAGSILVQLPSLELFDLGQQVRVVPDDRAAVAILDSGA
ncbi:MAG TPA: ABC transporter ATP-binding protein [Solirubrobacteraceae bacterium]|nr:ABC transporter ATP-binding protein [Solirubrobacteraceae bacterium]